MNTNLKILVVVLIIISIFNLKSAYASSNTPDERIELEEQENINKAIQEFTGFNLEELVPEKGYDFDVEGIINKVLSIIVSEFSVNVNLVLKILALAILIALLRAVSGDSDLGISQYGEFACNAVLIGILVVGMNICIDSGFNMIEKVDGFIKATMPLFATLLASSGAAVTGAVISPVLLLSSQISIVLLQNVFIPLLSLSLAFSAIDSILDKELFGGISKFFRSFCMWGMGIVFTIFVGIVSIQGIATGTTDGLGGRTAKFAITTLIPFAGGYLADSADTVLGSLSLVRNYTGIGIVIGIVVIIFIPVLKILGISLIYKITSLMIAPFVNQKTSDLISSVSSTIALIAGLCATVGGMIIIILAWLINTANGAVMMR